MISSRNFYFDFPLLILFFKFPFFILNFLIFNVLFWVLKNAMKSVKMKLMIRGQKRTFLFYYR